MSNRLAAGIFYQFIVRESIFLLVQVALGDYNRAPTLKEFKLMPHPRRTTIQHSLLITTIQTLTITLLSVFGLSCVIERVADQASKQPEKVVSSNNNAIKVGAAFRISQASSVAADRKDRTAQAGSIAYNPEDNEYLVIWETDALTEARGVRDIYGQRLNGSTGQPIGVNIRISNLSDGGRDRNSNEPTAVYNSTSHEYLVVWYGSGHVGTEDKISEIYGQRLSREGKELGSDFRISNTTDMGKVNTSFVRSSVQADVAWNSVNNQYLVAWKGMGQPEDVVKMEIYGQLLKANGDAIGNDFRISETTNQGNNFQTDTPAIAYSSGNNQYLVVWSGGFKEESQSEVWGRGVTDKGSVSAGGDFLISQVNTTAGANRRADSPDVAYNTTANEYLVVFQANILPGDVEISEVCGQRINAAKLTEVGTNDFRISTSAGGSTANGPRVTYNPMDKQFCVIWRSIRVNAPFEISGQLLGSEGVEIGGDFQISNVEALGKDRSVNGGSIAHNGRSNHYLVVWQGNAVPGAANSKIREIFGQQLMPSAAISK